VVRQFCSDMGVCRQCLNGRLAALSWLSSLRCVVVEETTAKQVHDFIERLRQVKSRRAGRDKS
jgi:hypothetical protein